METVKLKAKDVKDGGTQSFGVDQANKLLNMHKSQFELADDDFAWNGKELVRATKKSKEETPNPKV